MRCLLFSGQKYLFFLFAFARFWATYFALKTSLRDLLKLFSKQKSSLISQRRSQMAPYYKLTSKTIICIKPPRFTTKGIFLAPDLYLNVPEKADTIRLLDAKLIGFWSK